MELDKATSRQIGEELLKRGIDFVLIAVDDSGDMSVFSPDKIKDDRAGVFKMIRDYLNFLEQEGVPTSLE